MSDKSDSIDIPYYSTPPAYDYFHQHHLLPNKPALIGPTLTAGWKARNEWVSLTGNDKDCEPNYRPHYEYLRHHFGQAIVQVAECNKRQFTDQERREMTMSEFVSIWERDEGKNSNEYLKDWHFVQSFPNENNYTVPSLFEDDWLNEYWCSQGGEDDYRFAYMGGHGTFTPLHADVYRSYSWSSNICGIKKWTLFPPGQEECFKDRYGNRVYDIRAVDNKQFPRFKDAVSIVLYQRDGETLFVPSGWYHQVENIGSTLSINHNWSNACNLDHLFLSLQTDLSDVREAISDLVNVMSPEEYLNECQKLLLVHSGWDWKIFLKILLCIGNRLINHPQQPNQPDIQWQSKRILAVIDQLIETEGQGFIDYIKANALYDPLHTLRGHLLHTIEIKTT
ncbi:hypothetical protein BDB01DRAFT_792083 [Pilobolus umbonatus]|nr:hypothetical protein BDB01DRAFT_792083 [Pilobolus umbonatus]